MIQNPDTGPVLLTINMYPSLQAGTLIIRFAPCVWNYKYRYTA